MRYLQAYERERGEINSEVNQRQRGFFERLLQRAREGEGSLSEVKTRSVFLRSIKFSPFLLNNEKNVSKKIIALNKFPETVQ